MIHAAPVISYPNEQHEHIEKTLLADYAFEYGINHTAILLGYGMLFNHSYTPNATYDIVFENHTFNFYAYKDIKAGEEILINYNGEVDNDELLWFDKEKKRTKSNIRSLERAHSVGCALLWRVQSAGGEILRLSPVIK